MKIETVGVLGCGLMGAGIAEVCAAAGYRVLVREISDELFDRGKSKIAGSLDRQVKKGLISEADKDATLGRIQGVIELSKLASCDLVIEAIVENLDDKRQVFQALGEHLGDDAILASNTSSLTITQLAMTTRRPDRFLGLHFFNPVPRMQLVEVVKTLVSDAAVVEQGMEFVRSLGKEPVECRDNSGFIVNRLLVPYMLDAIRAFEEGVGSVEDIDKAMQLGCGYPMGPFTLLDFVGLDTTLYIANIMFDEYREKRFAPPPLLKQMVQAGRFGRKSGHGFYAYDKK